MADREVLTPEEVNLILQGAGLLKRAQIFEGNTQHPLKVIPITIALDTAKLSTDPFKIGFPFKSLFVSDATDTAVQVSLIPGARDSLQGAITLSKKDSWDSDAMVAEAYLYWSAQASKSITLLFFVDSSFRSGSQISVTAGGVSISSGSSATQASVNLAATTAAAIAPALSTRKQATIQNLSGADLYVGADNTITDTASTGSIRIADGGIIVWQNTGALYGYSVAGGRVNRLEEA
jgi:hypothetical protein